MRSAGRRVASGVRATKIEEAHGRRARYPLRIMAPRRILEPLVRDNGHLRSATWDEALDRAAAGIRASVARHGPHTFGLFSCSKATNEVNYAAQKFVRAAIGSNNIDSCNRT